MGMELPLDQTVPDMNWELSYVGRKSPNKKAGYIKESEEEDRVRQNRQTYIGLETQPLNVLIKFTLFNVLIN